MKKINSILFLFVILLASCVDSASPSKASYTDLQYKFYIENKANPKPAVGDVLSVELACVYKDSLLYKSSENYDNLRIIYKEHNDKLMMHKAFSLMHKGDSISLTLPSDSVLKFLGIDRFPIEIKSNETMQMNIKLLDFMSQEEFQNQLNLMKQKYVDNAEAILNQYIKDNNIHVEPLPSGLYFIETKEGKGNHPQKGEKVKIRYIAKLLNSKVIDNSMNNVTEIMLGRNQIFPGMEEGIMNMKKGGQAQLIIPYYLAFGEEGSSIAPPYSALNIEVELVDIVDRETVAKEKEKEEKMSVEKSKQIFDKYVKDNGLTNNKINNGMTYRVIEEGFGEKPLKNAKVKVHYVGKLIDGTIFDSSYERNQPFEFTLGKGSVLPGWDIAVSVMKLGEKAEFVMSQELVYKDYSLGMIKPYSNLVYEIELIDIE